MSLLTIVQNACARLAQPQPSAVIGSTDKQVLQMLGLVIQAGRDLSRDADWQALTDEQTFVTVATPAQTAAVPSDFDRFIPNSLFNRTTRRPVEGPITPQVWQALQAVPALATVYLMFRQRTGQFLITPTPPADQTIAYEYVSLNWAKSESGTPQSTFLADTDTTYLDESLLEDSLVWRFLRAKGLDYAEEMKTFEINKERAIARDGGSSALSIAAPRFDLSRANLPDGNFPGP